ETRYIDPLASLLRVPPPPPSTLFPYTTLFRSNNQHCPTSDRCRQVASSTSGLVDVATTDPGAPRMLGTTSAVVFPARGGPRTRTDRKSIRLNSSHVAISYAVFCLKKKKK